MRRKKEESESDTTGLVPGTSPARAYRGESSLPPPLTQNTPRLDGNRLDGAPQFDNHAQRRFGAPLNDLLQSPTANPYALGYAQGQGPSPAGTHSSAHSLNPQQTPHQRRDSLSPKRRRLHLNPPLHAADPSSIVVADMQNESDALHILALASGRAKGQRQSRSPSKTASAKPKGPIKALKDFPLVKLGIVTELQIINLSEVFFRCHHHLYVSPVRGCADVAYGSLRDYSQDPRPGRCICIQ